MFEFSGYMWLLLVTAIILILTTLSLWYMRRNDDYWEKRGVPYYPRQNIIQIFRMLSKMTLPELLLMSHKKYGRLFGGFQFSTPTISLADPELLRDVLVKDFHIFPNRRDISFKDPLLDNMVSVLKGEDWKRVRTVITPAFTSKQMRKMGDIINECSMTVTKTFEKHFHKGEPVDCKALFGAFTTDVIALSAFATKIDSLNNPDNIFLKMVKKTFQEFSIVRTLLLALIPQRLLIYFRIGSLKTMDFFKEVVVEVIKERRKSGQKYNDVLQTLMDAVEEQKSENKTSRLTSEDDTDHYGSIISTDISPSVKYKRLSEDELVAQCVLFFFVGYETTASTLSFMAYALALNGHWQDKLIAEVDEAFEKHNKMSYDVVRDMKILDAVVSETLRMYPPLLATERTALEDYKLGNTGITVEKGMNVGIPIYSMHYDPDFFSNPEEFNPERFIDTVNYSHPQYSYLPFGAGPRNCLGMRFALLEIKLCMANILRHYKLKVGPTTKVPIEYKKMSAFLSVNELPLAVEKRQ